MVNNNNPLSGLAGVVLIIAVIGLVAGLIISNADILNPYMSSAKARATEQELVVQAQRDAIDLQSYKVVQEAQTQAELAAIKNKERLMVLAGYTILVVGSVAILIVSAGLTVLLVQYGRGQLLNARNNFLATHAWKNPAYRAEQIRQARVREIEERTATLFQHAMRRVNAGVNGHEDISTTAQPAERSI